jgi:hypothetical protein
MAFSRASISSRERTSRSGFSRRGSCGCALTSSPSRCADCSARTRDSNGRFGQKIHFPDYTDDELLAILRRFCEQRGFELTPSAAKASPDVIARASAWATPFDNARLVRRLFERAVQRHHDRLFRLERAERRKATDAEQQELVAEDIPAAEELVPGHGVRGVARRLGRHGERFSSRDRRFRPVVTV